MKINKSLEQSIYVLTMLALQEAHKPVKSQVLSQILQVSDSYLKKILMKLSKAGLVKAHSSKNGGYQLAKSIDAITLRDVFFALELNQDVVDFHQLSRAIYDDEAHVKEGEQKILATIDRGLEAFYAELDTFQLSSLLHQEAQVKGAINWSDRLSQSDEY